MLIYASNVLERVDNLIFDIGQRITRVAAPDDVVIIAIDQQSLAEIGRWPWSRQVHADLLNRLNKEMPAAVGFDIIFAEPERFSLTADTAFEQAIKKSGKVVLPVLLETTRVNGQVIETLPMPDLMAATADVGRVHAVLDQDSIARSVFLYEGVGAPVWQLFAQAIINVAKGEKSKNNFNLSANQSDSAFTLVRDSQRRINFLGPTGHFQHISYTQVLNGEFPLGLFKNKVVLIGATALGMNDLLTTPVSGLSVPMAGVEFHANVLESLRSGSLITHVPTLLGFVVLAAIALMPLFWLPKSTSLAGFLSTLIFMMAITILLGLLPRLFSVWIPPAAALVSLVLAYPIWSWRKLEAAQKFLDYELNYLKSHLVDLPDDAYAFENRYDKFNARIAQVRKATEQLRFMNEDRKETLAFISHDLRAPLANALNVLEQHKALKSKLYQPLSQSLSLAEDFLQASRAEVMDSRQFQELDIAGLVHQAIDDAYDAATKKEIQLVREIPDDIVWVRGNFGLLHRAVSNLVSNAVKYTQSNTRVIVRLTLDTPKEYVTCSVTDYGPGIATKDHASLFKRFSRVKGHEKIAEGTGLGLYFVRTVAEKHLGTIHVDSDLGQPTTFSLMLPVDGVQLESDIN